jgi:iron complex outermembrane receptor protein
LRIGGDWRRNRWGAGVDIARYGEFCSFTASAADDQVFSPKWLTDVEVDYTVSRYTFGAGVQNLFDIFPDRNIVVNSFNGIQTFPSQSPFGMNGRAIYGRISVKL